MTLMKELAGRKPPFLVDIRSRREFEEGCLPEAINIPLDELRDRLADIPRDGPVVLQCGTGYRSYVAQQVLLNGGWTDVRNLYGGYGLAKRVYSMTKRYDTSVEQFTDEWCYKFGC